MNTVYTDVEHSALAGALRGQGSGCEKSQERWTTHWIDALPAAAMIIFLAGFTFSITQPGTIKGDTDIGAKNAQKSKGS